MTIYAYDTNQKYQDKPITKLVCYDYDKAQGSEIIYNYFKIVNDTDNNFFLLGKVDEVIGLKDNKDSLKTDEHLTIFEIHKKPYMTTNFKTREQVERSADKWELALTKFINNQIKIDKVYYGTVKLGSSVICDELLTSSGEIQEDNGEFKTYLNMFKKGNFDVKFHEDQSLLSDDLTIDTSNKKSGNSGYQKTNFYEQLKQKDQYFTEVVSKTLGIDYSDLASIYKAMLKNPTDAEDELFILNQLSQLYK